MLTEMGKFEKPWSASPFKMFWNRGTNLRQGFFKVKFALTSELKYSIVREQGTFKLMNDHLLY